MHMLGTPRTMQADPRYEDVAAEVAAFLEQRLAFAVDAGVPEELICLDPGIGFGKTVEQNFELVRRLDVLLALGRPVVIGFSRKSSLGRVLGDRQATTGPLSASLAAAVAAYERGATILRVHDVRETVEALAVARAVGGMTTIELVGLELHGYHGVNEDERRDGQPFVFDVWLEVPDGTGASDRIEDTSTTARWRRSSARSRTAGSSSCSRRSRRRSPRRCSPASRPRRRACASASRR